MITLIGTTKQYQLEIIGDKLRARGYEVALIDFLKNSSVKISQIDGVVNISCDGQSLDGTKVVYHDPKYLVEHFGDTPEWIERYITLHGWKNANNSIFELLSGKKLNSLATIYPFFAKLKQLSVAAAHGLKVPSYILANDRNTLAEFAKEHHPVITKDIGIGTIPTIEPKVGQRVIMTSPVTAEMIAESEEKQPFPMLLQKNITKKYEYRVVVAGTQHCAFQIDPHQHPIMELDYRRGGFMVRYKPSKLPQDMISKILSLHDAFGLFSGSYDFIEGLDGQFYFLEVNPAGVWAFIDQTSEGIISDMFVDEISRIYEEAM